MAKSNEGNNGEPKTNGKGGLTTLRSLFVGERSSNSANRKAVNGLASIHPFIAEILGGVEASGDQKEILPGSITIFVREGKVRFSANVKSADTTIIGEVSDPINVWDSITTHCRAAKCRQNDTVNAYLAQRKSKIRHIRLPDG